MKISEVDIEIIYKLLLSVPQGMEIESIDLTNGYSLKMIAGTQEIYALEKKTALDELNQIIRKYKHYDNENCKQIKKGKNYLGIK